MNRNGMGPNNEGPMTGRGNGFCSGNSSYRNYRGAFCRGRGFGQGLRRDFSDKEVEAFIGRPNADIKYNKGNLNEQKEYYQRKLDEINKKLQEI
jgi:hypothetical protein